MALMLVERLSDLVDDLAGGRIQDRLLVCVLTSVDRHLAVHPLAGLVVKTVTYLLHQERFLAWPIARLQAKGTP